MPLNLSQEEDKRLVIRLTQGDEDAFCELYTRYKKRLIYFAMRFIKSGSYAEDLFQDVFTLVWQNRRCLDPNQSFSAYVHTILRNRLLNELRLLSTNQKFREYILENAADTHREVEELVNFNQLNDLLQKSITLLTPRQREVFLLSRDHHLSHKEIADRLGISIPTVQEHISLSLKIIRSHVGKEKDLFVDLCVLLFLLQV